MNQAPLGLPTIAAVCLASIPAAALDGIGQTTSAINEIGTPAPRIPQAETQHAIAGCQPQWNDGFHTPSVLGIESLAVFDDGSGPALFVGGSFGRAWDTLAQTIVRWDGKTWTALPEKFGPYAPMIDIVSVAKSMLVFDDGNGPGLFIGGYFSTVGDVVVNAIAKWDGQTWSALGNGFYHGNPCTPWSDPVVHALAVFDDGNGPALYAAGSFTCADEGPASNIARWNGTSWSPLGPGLDMRVYALAVLDDGNGPALYCGGSSQTMPGSVGDTVARWNGSSWSILSTGIDAIVYALAVYDDGSGPGLYAGGDFADAGGNPASHIARWDGITWSSVGGGLVGNAGVRSLAVFDGGDGPDLYAGGYFTRAGDIDANRIAKWDGIAWSPVGGGVDPVSVGTERVGAMTVFDFGNGERLFVAGWFESVGGVYAHGIAQWDGAAWSPMQGAPAAGLNGRVFDMTAGNDGPGPGLFAGGEFTRAGSQPLNFIGKWDGVSWSPLGTGMNGWVNAVTFFDDGTGTALFVGGGFTAAGGVPASRAAKWSGGAWTPLGGGLGGYAAALAGVPEGPAHGLYAGGGFTTAEGLPANRIARWDGTAWSRVGSGLSGGFVQTLASFDDGTGPQLYAGGSFTVAGGISARRVARWDGTSWRPLGNGLPATVNELAALHDGGGPALYAGWQYGISRWNGSEWIEIGSTSTGSGPVHGIARFDDGSGPALFAAGYFLRINGVYAPNIAKWDGSMWHDVVGWPGVDAGVYDLAVFHDRNGSGLFLGGELLTVGDTPSAHIARWYNPCMQARPIPTASPWGVALMALATIAAAGAVLLRRRCA